MTFDDIKSTANLLRYKIKGVGEEVTNLKDNATAVVSGSSSEQKAGVDCGEVLANIQLAFRHIEDARMRLGKCIQAIDGGKSIYDEHSGANISGTGPSIQ